MILAEETPEGWGLLYDVGTAFPKKIKCPNGNFWPPYGSGNSEWARFQNRTDEQAERQVLFSIARRLIQGASVIKT